MLEGGAGGASVIVEDQDMLECRVLRVVPRAIDVRLHDLFDLVTRQQRRRRSMIRTRDQHLASADGIALPEASQPMFLAVGFEAECGVKVGHDPDPPALGVRGCPCRSVGEHLRRRHGFMPRAEGAKVAGCNRFLGRLGE